MVMITLAQDLFQLPPPPPNQEFTFPSFNMVLYPSTLLTLGICPAGVVATALHQNPKLNTAIMQLYELVQSGDIQD